MAASLGALAKDGHWLKSRVSAATAKTDRLQDQLKGLKGLLIGGVAKGALGAGLALGVTIGAVLLAFFGVYLALAKVMDPALAALVPSVVVFAALGAVAVLAGRTGK